MKLSDVNLWLSVQVVEHVEDDGAVTGKRLNSKTPLYSGPKTAVLESRAPVLLHSQQQHDEVTHTTHTHIEHTHRTHTHTSKLPHGLLE